MKEERREMEEALVGGGALVVVGGGAVVRILFFALPFEPDPKEAGSPIAANSLLFMVVLGGEVEGKGMQKKNREVGIFFVCDEKLKRGDKG